jgi:antagonist of KipI
MIQVVKQGLLDTIQDEGRYGYQHLGINPGGAMDRVALYLANSLVGNDLKEAAIELHFPASAFLFEEDAMIALSGADFGAMINDIPISINKPVLISRNSILRFTRPVSGARCYLAIRGGLVLERWLNSFSTHLKAEAGGLEGRRLQKNDRLPFKLTAHYEWLPDALELPWSADIRGLYPETNTIRILKGSDWVDDITCATFLITEQSDRMGFRLKGPAIHTAHTEERLSAGVTRGTIQLLPDGQLIILMADHQTTGGYPRVAHVITADLPALAQYNADQRFSFQLTDLDTATQLYNQQEQHLLLLQNACNLRLQEWTDYEYNRSKLRYGRRHAY